MNIVEKIFGTHSERELKRILPLVDKIEARMAPVAAGPANSDTRFHREKWPSSLTRGRLFHSADKQAEFDSRDQQRQ